ncbi:Alpha/Beta hydrolase protein [Fimicolochytrium jonesii]|uniref:Alpha/Beta hydrolase protein n=1 Tax=Fimicolochytrium jonesii TaxID=1396493 RepID=UPI0022FE50AB|nr:Alpha/Beta hydrolase protein [Fimicolochytrium jonesii]KAI8826146.1 Alpha/Beta hydrolase protein [Fimicolochytrium jonesii]
MTTATEELPACCRQGYVHDGVAKGTVENLHGLKTYVAKPANFPTSAAESPRKCIVFLTDVFGLDFINNRLYADNLANSSGLTVYLPDLFNGTAMAPEPVMKVAEDREKVKGIVDRLRLGLTVVKALPTGAQFLVQNNDKTMMARLSQFLNGLIDIDRYKREHIGAIGHCWGGRYATLLAHEAKVACFAVAHTSRTAVPGDIEPIKIPALFLCAEEDVWFSTATRLRAEECLKKRREEATQAAEDKVAPVTTDYEFVVYRGTTHGFACRGDVSDPLVKAAVDGALTKASLFFQQYLI